MWVFALACSPPAPPVRRPPPSATPSTVEDPTDASGAIPIDTALIDTALIDTAPADSGTLPVPPCAPEMALVGDAVCVDRWEAHLDGGDPYTVPTAGVAVSEAGEVPQGYISGDIAAEACAAAGKRLCTLDEWLLACSGDEGRIYPYGDTYVDGACNEGRETHPVIELFGAGATWSSAEMNDPRLNQLPDSLALAGTYSDCVTPDGVYDLHGNLHEWIDDPAGTFKGGFYVDATLNGPGCSYVTTAHSMDYHDYSTGFRCCAAPAE